MKFLKRHIIRDDEDREVAYTVRFRGCDDAVTLGVSGCGMAEMPPGFDQIIALEVHEGKPRLIVWSDISNDEPTHVIDLSPAFESLRVDSM